MSDQKQNAFATLELGILGEFDLKVIPVTEILSLKASVGKQDKKCRLTVTGQCKNIPDNQKGTLKFVNYYDGIPQPGKYSIPVQLRAQNGGGIKSYQLKDVTGQDLICDPLMCGFAGQGISDLILEMNFPYTPVFAAPSALTFKFPLKLNIKKSNGDVIGSEWKVTPEYDSIFDGCEITVSYCESDEGEIEAPIKQKKDAEPTDYAVDLTWAPENKDAKSFHLGCTQDLKLAYAREYEQGNLEIKSTITLKRDGCSVTNSYMAIAAKKIQLNSFEPVISSYQPGHSSQPNKITSFSVKGSFSGFDPAIPLKIECTLLGVENENIITDYDYISQVIEVQENGTFIGKVADLIDQELPEPNDLTKLVYHAALRFTKDCLYSSVIPPILNILKSKTLPVNSLSSANMVLQPQTWILSSPATSDGKILAGRTELITIDELKGIIPKAKMDNIIKYYPHINDTLKEFEINTKLRIAYFLCHVPVETGSLDLLEQNTRSSSQYIGRGIIQLTGECNYKAFSEFLKRPEILTNPGCVASDPTLTCRSAGWWWRFSDKNDANGLADKEDFVGIVKKVNYKFNGLAERWETLKLAYKILNIPDNEIRLNKIRVDAGRNRIVLR